ncbi:hypothetical protein FRC03_009307 [Tulasnella sp. 419]|nr:hypothetical protein FRC03_009307 [Tulasnella sp. 419]
MASSYKRSNISLPTRGIIIDTTKIPKRSGVSTKCSIVTTLRHGTASKPENAQPTTGTSSARHVRMVGPFTQVRKLDTKLQMKEREEGKAERLNFLKGSSNIDVSNKSSKWECSGLSVSDRKRIKGLAYDAAAENDDSNWDLDFSHEESPEEELVSDDGDVVEEYTVERSGKTYSVVVDAHRGSYYIVPAKAR